MIHTREMTCTKYSIVLDAIRFRYPIEILFSRVAFRTVSLVLESYRGDHPLHINRRDGTYVYPHLRYTDTL